ncbi:DUF2735 domain-containing protein [uncultured Alsobacter sp.]|uniref:DUF2735 domain-containing protein n=1 Tax=uncultured Alsobacter sp. TaxID=1748258 RepID=UPI0025DB3EC5|nr:DUF2735 domain-containing protein [uncultured Alsobacter sp.]
MPEHPERKSAVIYPFPSRPRVAGGDLRQKLRDPATPGTGYPATTFGSGWYHDAAIRESAPDRKP